MSLWPADEFLKWLDDQITVSIEAGQAGNTHDGFLLWCLRNHYGLTEGEAQQAMAISGKGDSGIDAAWVKGNRLWIIQAKTCSPITENSTFNDKPAKELFAALLALVTPGAKAPQSLRAVASLYKETVESGGSVELVSLVSGQAGKALTVAIDRINAEFRRDSTRAGHHAQIVQQKDLNRSYVESLAGMTVEPVELPILRTGAEPSYHYLDSSHDAVAVDAPAVSLATWVEKHSFAIVAKNLRYPLYTSYNEGMLSTLRDSEERKNFWLYNNGTTVVCEAFQHVPAAGNKGAHFLVRGPQIVNGCQTAFTLNRFLEEAKDDVARAKAREVLASTKLLVRLIAISPGRDAKRIAQYTNSQNAIGPRDLVSNDEVQVVLQRTFGDAGYFYERKHGEWAAMRGKGKRAKGGFSKGALDNESLAQIALAFWLQLPQPAKNEAKLIFARGTAGHYDRIFAPDSPTRLTMNELLVCSLVEKIQDAWLKKWIKANKPTQQSKQATVRKYEVAKNADLYLLAIVGRVVQEGYNLQYLQGPASPVAQRMRNLVDRLEISSKKNRADALTTAITTVGMRALDLIDDYCEAEIARDPDITPRRILVRRSTYEDAGLARRVSKKWVKETASLLPDL